MYEMTRKQRDAVVKSASQDPDDVWILVEQMLDAAYRDGYAAGENNDPPRDW